MEIEQVQPNNDSIYKTYLKNDKLENSRVIYNKQKSLIQVEDLISIKDTEIE